MRRCLPQRMKQLMRWRKMSGKMPDMITTGSSSRWTKNVKVLAAIIPISSMRTGFMMTIIIHVRAIWLWSAERSGAIRNSWRSARSRVIRSRHPIRRKNMYFHSIIRCWSKKIKIITSMWLQERQDIHRMHYLRWSHWPIMAIWNWYVSYFGHTVWIYIRIRRICSNMHLTISRRSRWQMRKPPTAREKLSYGRSRRRKGSVFFLL